MRLNVQSLESAKAASKPFPKKTADEEDITLPLVDFQKWFKWKWYTWRGLGRI